MHSRTTNASWQSRPTKTLVALSSLAKFTHNLESLNTWGTLRSTNASPTSKLSATKKILRTKILHFIEKYKYCLEPVENTFLERAMNETKGRRVAEFCMTIKVHKKPWKMRPIVCCIGTLGNYISRWLDYWFQKLKPFVSSYIKKNSTQLLAKLKKL